MAEKENNDSEVRIENQNIEEEQRIGRSSSIGTIAYSIMSGKVNGFISFHIKGDGNGDSIGASTISTMSPDETIKILRATADAIEKNTLNEDTKTIGRG